MQDRSSRNAAAGVIFVVISLTLIPAALGGLVPQVVAMGALAHAATSFEETEGVTEIDVRKLPSWLVNYRLEDYARSAMKAEVPIDEVISKAEKRKHAPAVDAGIAKPLSGSNAVLAYFVETIDGSRREELAVDARTGLFVKNPASLFEPRTPVELARRLLPGTG
jgi:hypothetical protein